MAKNATVVPKLGRHFLSVPALGKFLATSAAASCGSTKAVYERCLKGQQTCEVNVVSVGDELATCTFFARGGLMETIHVPMSCLALIKPVVGAPAPKQDVYSELNRLVNVAI